MFIIPDLSGCGQPATIRIEVYSPRDDRLHGSLDASVYTCEQHGIEAVSAISAAGFTPHRTDVADLEQIGDELRRCGAVHDYVNRSALTAPEPATVSNDVNVDVSTQPIRHPRWCRNREQCLSVGVHVGQVHPINPDRTSGDETALVCAWLAQGVHPAESLHAIVLQITDEGVTRHHWLPVGQARVLVHVVRNLLDDAKRAE